VHLIRASSFLESSTFSDIFLSFSLFGIFSMSPIKMNAFIDLPRVGDSVGVWVWVRVRVLGTED